jgi:3-carboxy-cis,cis-muconate cycloisomerase
MSLVKDYLGPADSGHWFADARWLDALLRFESALAQAQADCGLVPRPAAEAIARACAQAPLTCEGVVEQARASGALGLAALPGGGDRGLRRVGFLVVHRRDHASRVL